MVGCVEMGAEVNANDPAGGDSSTTPGQGGTGAEGAAQTPNQEAAAYRVKLREAEAERDRLAGVVAGMQRAAVEELAEKAGIKPKALWLSGVDLADLLVAEGEDGAGTIDRTKVDAAITTAREELGIEDPTKAGLRNHVVGTTEIDRSDTDAWEKAFSPGNV